MIKMIRSNDNVVPSTLLEIVTIGRGEQFADGSNIQNRNATVHKKLQKSSTGRIFQMVENKKNRLKLALKNTKSPVLPGFQMYQYLCTDLVGHLGLEPRTDRL